MQIKTSDPQAFVSGIAQLMEKAKSEEGIFHY